MPAILDKDHIQRITEERLKFLRMLDNQELDEVGLHGKTYKAYVLENAYDILRDAWYLRTSAPPGSKDNFENTKRWLIDNYGDET